MTFLGTCGTEFEEINKEHKAMTREQKLMNASRRVSTKISQLWNDYEEDAQAQLLQAIVVSVVCWNRALVYRCVFDYDQIKYMVLKKMQVFFY